MSESSEIRLPLPVIFQDWDDFCIKIHRISRKHSGTLVIHDSGQYLNRRGLETSDPVPDMVIVRDAKIIASMERSHHPRTQRGLKMQRALLVSGWVTYESVQKQPDGSLAEQSYLIDRKRLQSFANQILCERKRQRLPVTMSIISVVSLLLLAAAIVFHAIRSL